MLALVNMVFQVKTVKLEKSVLWELMDSHVLIMEHLILTLTIIYVHATAM